MNYSSISPQNALPTPPHSPGAPEHAPGAVVLLDSLTAFYQQERYWIHHTRAALEVAIAKGSDARAITFSDTSPDNSTSSSAVSSPGGYSPESSVATEASAVVVPLAAAVIKTEPDLPPSMHDELVQKRNTRWNRRKNMMKLKIEGISPHSRRRRPHRAPPSEPGARLLEMFSELVDARMESCQRVSRLVRDARRPDLCLAMC